MSNSSTTPEPPRPDREEQARREIGITAISRNQIRVVVVLALFGLFAVPVLQTVRDLRSGRPLMGLDFLQALPAAWRTGGVMASNRAVLREIDRLEQTLEDESILTGALLSPAQQVLTGVGGVGNEEAYPGRDGWVFYRPGIDSMAGAPFLDMDRLLARARSGSEVRAAPRPDPIPAIHAFAAQLRAHGVELIVMPAPVKGQIHPEAFSRRYADGDTPVRNPSFETMVAELADPALTRARYAGLAARYAHLTREERSRNAIGPLLDAVEVMPEQSRVRVFDPAPVLMARKRATGEAQYLATDTHWRPEAMQAVAADLAAAIAPMLSPSVRQYTHTAVSVTNLGDVAAMLRLPEDQRLYAAETVTIQRVAERGHRWQSDPSAEVLLLGDSFCNIYSLDAMGWGGQAGFAEQLAFALQRPVDAIVRNDAGAYATRELLMDELASNPERLAGKRIAVWAFAERELSVGDWKLLTLRTGAPEEREASGEFMTVDAGAQIPVIGTVAQLSMPPNLQAPYRDHVMEVVLQDVVATDPDRPLTGDTVYVAMMSMREKRLLAPAHLREGDRLALVLHHYQTIDGERRVRKLKSSMLDDEELFDVTVQWGEPVTPDTEPERVPAGWPEGVALLLTLVGCVGAVWVAERREGECGSV